MSLALDKPIHNVPSNLHTNSKDAPKIYQTWKVLYAKQAIPAQKFIEFKNNSNKLPKICNIL